MGLGYGYARWVGLVTSQLAVAGERSPPFFVGLAPRRALDLDPGGPLSGAIGRIAALRHNALKP